MVTGVFCLFVLFCTFTTAAYLFDLRCCSRITWIFPECAFFFIGCCVKSYSDTIL